MILFLLSLGGAVVSARWSLDLGVRGQWIQVAEGRGAGVTSFEVEEDRGVKGCLL